MIENEKLIQDTLSKFRPVDFAEGYAFQASYGLNHEDYPELMRRLYSLGNKWEFTGDLRGVYLPVGNHIPSHDHEKWHVLVYMPMVHTSMLKLHDPNEDYSTAKGSFVYIPRGRNHSVVRNDDMAPRISIAALFEEKSIRDL